MDSSLAGERQGQWLRGVLDLVVLAVLRRDGESYGYLLLQALADTGLGDIKGGTLYPLLNRLERDGLVTSSWRTGDSGPARKYFTITPAGSRELDDSSAGWAEFSRCVAAALAPDSADGTVTAIHHGRRSS